MSEEQSALVSVKGWGGAGDVLRDYQQLEGAVGTPPERLLRLPADPNDTEAMGAIYRRLGHPETAEGYEFPAVEVPEGQVDLMPWFRESAHKRNMPSGMAEGMVQDYLAFAQEQAAKHVEALNLRDQTELDALKTEWGGAYTERTAAATKFYAAVGMDQATKERLEDAMGSKWFLEFGSVVGLAIGEANFVTTDSGSSDLGGKTPIQAKAELDTLMMDKDWAEKAMNREGSPEREHFLKLHQRMATAGGPPTGSEPPFPT